MEIDKNLDIILIMILDMRNIYIKYLNLANHANKQCKKIRTIALMLEQELQISNNKRQETITLLKSVNSKIKSI